MYWGKDRNVRTEERYINVDKNYNYEGDDVEALGLKADNVDNIFDENVVTNVVNKERIVENIVTTDNVYRDVSMGHFINNV